MVGSGFASGPGGLLPTGFPVGGESDGSGGVGVLVPPPGFGCVTSIGVPEGEVGLLLESMYSGPRPFRSTKFTGLFPP